MLLKNDNIKAVIENGQIASLKYKSQEIMHTASLLHKTRQQINAISKSLDKGGWGVSGIEMFPRVGKYPGGKGAWNGKSFILDGHGISRAIGYVEDDGFTVQKHNGKPVPNPKYSIGGTSPEKLVWPFAYELRIRHILGPESITREYWLKGDEQPYQFGTHPAFKGTKDPSKGRFSVQGDTFTIDDLVARKTKYGCLQLPDNDEIHYTDLENNTSFRLTSLGFGNLQLWTPFDKQQYTGMFCIEPVTHLESDNGFNGNSRLLHKGVPARFSYTIEFLHL